MRISELEVQLKKIREQQGDLLVVVDDASSGLLLAIYDDDVETIGVCQGEKALLIDPEYSNQIEYE